jgi:hypothetical protein
MNFDNAASYQADATTKRPRPVFTCDMAKSTAHAIKVQDSASWLDYTSAMPATHW